MDHSIEFMLIDGSLNKINLCPRTNVIRILEGSYMQQ